ncbi:uncharacterized protein DUF2637 [Streptomyces sp. 1114.5]|uniref:DUF2637 domain-containing protein n=1 Tax=unclassified Streptomyces TaxID=2593676 RepID=UPI000BD85094|nr:MULTISPECIES: DUF2637 domain-containing protein [unclassified Streptomyces]RKT18599.1 uncharacterized protein DUF2637 [Streptomyces sp. 1114.5]SOB84801.1 Protein of unknown function [Streptomyces sp. 1331.2]
MKLSDIPLGWAVTVVAGLLVSALLVALLRSRGSTSAGGTDSWERSEERRHRKESLYGAASYTLLFCCAGVAAALSFHGLVGFGVQNLGLSGGWEYLVPFGLDGAAMFCSVLAVREASHGDAALGSRLLVWLFAGASAWFNWVHAPRGFGHAGAPQFFSGMSLSAAILFDRALKQTRRAALREQGLVPRPLPQIRIVRWLRAPRETYAAWSLMLLENVRSLDEAVDEVREEKRERALEKERRKLAGRRERAEIRAINRSTGGWRRSGVARQLESGSESAIAGGPGAERPAAAELPGAERPAVERPGAERPGLERPQAERPGAERASAPREVEAAEGKVVQPGLPARPERRTIDLTVEEDTVTLPRLDSLERKLKDLEQQFG